MAWILGVIILVLMLAFCVYQFREATSAADRFDLSKRD